MGTSTKVLLQVTHEVKNYDQWKEAFDSQKDIREKAGIKVKNIYVSADNANLVTVITKAPSVEVAKSFTANPNLKAVMESAGVISAPDLKILIKQK